MYYLEEFYKERYCGRKPAIFWLVFFSYMCIINMYESVRQVHKMDYTVCLLYTSDAADEL